MCINSTNQTKFNKMAIYSHASISGYILMWDKQVDI